MLCTVTEEYETHVVLERVAVSTAAMICYMCCYSTLRG
jgi:hypothetical protein